MQQMARSAVPPAAARAPRTTVLKVGLLGYKEDVPMVAEAVCVVGSSWGCQVFRVAVTVAAGAANDGGQSLLGSIGRLGWPGLV